MAPQLGTIHDQLIDIAQRSGLPIDRVVEEHAERAAIREYLGNMSRDEAEQAAICDTRSMFGLEENP